MVNLDLDLREIILRYCKKCQRFYSNEYDDEIEGHDIFKYLNFIEIMNFLLTKKLPEK